MDKEFLKKIIDFAKKGNRFNEKIVLVGATKYQPIDVVNDAISQGLENIGENKADEFRDKFEFYLPSTKHFIGHLQTNKIKYLVGKIDFFVQKRLTYLRNLL